MSASTVSLASLSPAYRRPGTRRQSNTDRGRALLWLGGLTVIALLYFGVQAFWFWKHPISSSGGRYFINRVAISIPAFQQDDPRWTYDLLGPTADTLGLKGCAVTSAAMVLAAYGVDTDPQRLNNYLTKHAGYTSNGWLYWEKAAEIAPAGQVEKAYEDLPSYALIDKNLQAGNPVIIRLTLRNGHTHFVVIVGKDGWDYLIEDPARPPTYGIYPLKELTDRIEALRYFRIVPPLIPPVLTAATPATSQP